MKNDILRYMLRHDLKKRFITFTAVCAGIVCLFSILFMIFTGGKSDSDMSNVITVFACVYTFVSVIGIVVKVHGMELCFNRSRISGIKAVFAELLIVIPFNAVIAIACEYVLSKHSGDSIIWYEFKPFLSLLGLGSTDGAAGILASFGLMLLVLYAISMVAALIMTMIYKFGKMAWVGFWIVYMLLIFGADVFTRPFKRFAGFLGISTGMLALFSIIFAALLFTVLFVILYRKSEMGKSLLKFAKAA